MKFAAVFLSAVIACVSVQANDDVYSPPKPRPAPVARRPAHFVQREVDGVMRWLPPTEKRFRLAARQGPSAVPKAPISFQDVGCWDDSGYWKVRALSTFKGTHMLTPSKCQMLCVEEGFKYAGTKNSDQCYCGNEIIAGHQVPFDECDTPCIGQPNMICGGSHSLSLYRLDSAPDPTEAKAVAEVKSDYGTYEHIDCYVDGKGFNRMLSVHIVNDYNLTLQACADACVGFSVFGVEYNYQCFCGDDFNEYRERVDPEDCNWPCAGDPTQSCGGANAIDIYAISSDLF